MFDVVILYKKENTGGTDIKFALRSIEKYLIGYRNVYLIGIRPTWCSIDKFIPVQDLSLSDHKERNIILKILAACENKDISENFVCWHDDHFLLKHIHVSAIKNWFDIPLKEKEKQKLTTNYRKALENTIELTQGKKQLNPIHAPIIFNKEKFKALFKDIRKEVIIKSIYMADEEVSEMKDCKIHELFDNTKEKVYRRINGRHFFSCSEHGQGIITQVLEELYSEKNKFEK